MGSCGVSLISLLRSAFVFQAFPGTVVEKELPPCLTPHPAAAHPVLPAVPEREELVSRVSDVTKRVSKFKAARLQQKN